MCDLNNSGDSSKLALPLGETPPATFATVKSLLEGTLGAYGCTGVDCHREGSTHTPMQLPLGDTLYTTLTTHVSAECCNLKVVEPGYPARSALIRALKGSCGDVAQMPNHCIPGPEGDCLPSNYVEAIEQWVAAGAPQE
jgi:hypothetical protein